MKKLIALTPIQIQRVRKVVEFEDCYGESACEETETLIELINEVGNGQWTYMKENLTEITGEQYRRAIDSEGDPEVREQIVKEVTSKAQ